MVTIWLRLIGLRDSNKVNVRRVDRGKLHSVASSWSVPEVSIARIDAIVTKVIEDHEVSWSSIFCRHLLAHDVLTVNRVGQANPKVCKYVSYET
jgi:hypothetical protein